MVGHDTGYIVSYALAADHRDRVSRLVLAEIPGPPGVTDPNVLPAPLFLPEFLSNRLWHILFNRVNDELIVDMVRSNAIGYYGYEFAIQNGGVPLPQYAIDYYTNLYNRDRNALRASFGLYRAWGPAAAGGIAPVAVDVQTLVIPRVGHWVAEQAPAQMLTALGTFLAPYLQAPR
ncbi:alpha/beta hydrolase [Kribbella sp. NBC_00662]